MTSARAVLWWKSRRWLRTWRHCRASCRRSRRRLPEPSLARALRRSRSSDPRPRLVEEPRVGNDLAIGGGQESGHANVNTSRAAGGNQRLGDLLGHHDHVPAAVLPLELQRLHPAVDGPMLVDLDAPDRLEGRVRPPPLPAGSHRAVPGDEQHLAEPLVGLEPRIARVGRLLAARLRPPGGLHPLEERREGRVSRRNVCCCAVNECRPWPSGSSARISRSWADWSP